jgi:selenocysteine lyase/cysteine desulfurase
MLTAVATRAETFFDELRDREFGRLAAQNQVYVDYAGSALYGESQVRAVHDLLQQGVFGNPHSASSSSRASSEVIESARNTVLQFFDVDASTHDVCFTANATAAIKLVAEGYPFSPETTCVLSTDNHNSVNGIREYARRAGAKIRYLPLDRQLRLRDAELVLAVRNGGLLAFPAQSNFSGVLHPLDLIDTAHRRGFDVLIDAAAFAPGHALSLRRWPADFAALSFYKLFGYPTGLGALIARRDALARLRRPWFAGGTVMYASVQADAHLLRQRHEAFEDGTPHFLGIAALASGFALLEEVGFDRLTSHVDRLTHDFLEELTALRHRSGRNLARVYGPSDMTRRGGTIAFNLSNRDGDPIPYWIVEARAREMHVSLRGGCFCNPGASEVAFGLDANTIATCFENLGHDFTVERFAACTDKPVGAVRVSFGMANNSDDVNRTIDAIAAFRD